MALHVTFSNSAALGGATMGAGPPSSTLRTLPNGEVECLRNRVVFPFLQVDYVLPGGRRGGGDGQGDFGGFRPGGFSPDGTRRAFPEGTRNFLLWRVEHAEPAEDAAAGAPGGGAGEGAGAGGPVQVVRCRNCSCIHILGFKKLGVLGPVISHPMLRYGIPVDGLLAPDTPPTDPTVARLVTLTDEEADLNQEPDWSAAPPTVVTTNAELYAEHLSRSTFPVVAYGSLGTTGRGVFGVILSCNSHYHDQRRFVICVQLVALDPNNRIVLLEEGRSPPIRVLSKFLERKRAPNASPSTPTARPRIGTPTPTHSQSANIPGLATTATTTTTTSTAGAPPAGVPLAAGRAASDTSAMEARGTKRTHRTAEAEDASSSNSMPAGASDRRANSDMTKGVRSLRIAWLLKNSEGESPEMAARSSPSSQEGGPAKRPRLDGGSDPNRGTEYPPGEWPGYDARRGTLPPPSALGGYPAGYMPAGGVYPPPGRFGTLDYSGKRIGPPGYTTQSGSAGGATGSPDVTGWSSAGATTGWSTGSPIGSASSPSTSVGERPGLEEQLYQAHQYIQQLEQQLRELRGSQFARPRFPGGAP